MNNKLDFTDEEIIQFDEKDKAEEGSNLKNTKISNVVHLLTALFFMLFIVYQLYLLVQINENRIGRILGIGTVLLITVASFLALIPKPAFRIIRSVTMIAGLSLIFLLKLLNAPAMIYRLDASNIPSVLNFVVYVFSQTGKLFLLLYYLVFRHNKKLNSKRKLVIALMSVVIVLFVACLIMECVLILKYHSNIDLSMKYTLVSRLLYCFGYVGIAVSFMLPISEIDSSDDIMNQKPDDDDLMFSASEEAKMSSGEAKNPALGEVDKDFVIY